ncbi:entry exclusion protein TrbK [Mesorhizobium sp. CCNWLW179-1]|uniref:entry exclusion protein TrbK n=1 Tax=unclassified Mesorhizobium TaxID=325217 RepID=UPI00301505E0
MVNRSSLLIFVVGCIVGFSAGAITWAVMLPERSAPTITPSSDAERQKRAKEFFGGKREYDLEGGQEMRPRW